MAQGADLSHIFCAEEAAIPIKSFSPELIVHPVLRTRASVAVASGVSAPAAGAPDEVPRDHPAVKDVVAKVRAWLPRMDSLVIGPGLGRDAMVQACARGILAEARILGLPVVLDADGLWLVAQDVSVVRGYANAVLTPNVVEFARLADAVTRDDASVKLGVAGGVEQVRALAAALGNVTILQKGATDMISDGRMVVECDEAGSPRRCGGQGDVVSGLAGLFLSWAASKDRRDAVLARTAGRTATGARGAGSGGGEPDEGAAAAAAVAEPAALSSAESGSGGGDEAPSATVNAALGASLLTRHAARVSFAAHGRGMTTPDLMAALPAAFEAVFPGRLHDGMGPAADAGSADSAKL